MDGGRGSRMTLFARIWRTRRSRVLWDTIRGRVASFVRKVDDFVKHTPPCARIRYNIIIITITWYSWDAAIHVDYNITTLHNVSSVRRSAFDLCEVLDSPSYIVCRTTERIWNFFCEDVASACAFDSVLLTCSEADSRFRAVTLNVGVNHTWRRTEPFTVCT